MCGFIPWNLYFLFPILLRVCPDWFCWRCKSLLYCHFVHYDNGLFIKIIKNFFHSLFVCSLSLFGAFLIFINKESVRLHSARQERQHFPYILVYHYDIRMNNMIHNQVSLCKRGACWVKHWFIVCYKNTSWPWQVFLTGLMGILIFAICLKNSNFAVLLVSLTKRGYVAMARKSCTIVFKMIFVGKQNTKKKKYLCIQIPIS